jgi:selenocysteine-specific elongation factor
MRSLIVGTAGHIDHGKSALVRALTGTDPDRLKEEKERGITIDLGFAFLDLGQGRVASFIDVPGHERFVRNMLAGAHGIDAVLLVVAADESVMPQTREHFHICRLLGITHGLVVLTKCDIADADSQTVAEMEARELVAGSFLAGAPVLRVSARTGQGLAELRDALDGLARGLAPRPTGGVMRLPVDRAFTMRGFGTVVTGTLVSGALAAGDEVELLPAGRRARVRGLQVHGQAVDRVDAGNRTAVNLAGVEVADIARGDVLARPGTLRSSRLLDVEVRVLPGGKPLRDLARVRVHVASAERLARVRLLGAEGAEPDRMVRAQLRLEAPAVAGRGDRLVLRSYSPAATIGGAVVLDPVPPTRRRRDAVTAAAAPAVADAAAAARALVQQAGPAGIDTPSLAARLTVPPEDVSALLAPDGDLVAVGRDPVWYVARAALEGLAEGTRAALERFHADNPLKAAMPREELRRRVFGRSPDGTFERVLESLATAGQARLVGDGLALARHAVRLSPQEEQARSALLVAARAAGLEGVDLDRVATAARLARPVLDRVASVLLAEGELRRVGEGLVDAHSLDMLKARVRERWPPGSRLDVGAFKDLTGLSRKFTIPLLEYLDRERVTRRSGNDRLVLS